MVQNGVAPARLAVLEARDQDVRPLLDAVIQQLFALGLTVQSVATTLGGGDGARRLTEALTGVDDTIQQIREHLTRG